MELLWRELAIRKQSKLAATVVLSTYYVRPWTEFLASLLPGVFRTVCVGACSWLTCYYRWKTKSGRGHVPWSQGSLRVKVRGLTWVELNSDPRNSCPELGCLPAPLLGIRVFSDSWATWKLQTEVRGAVEDEFTKHLHCRPLFWGFSTLHF